MKHFFTLLISFILLNGISAQVIYNQDFSAGFGDMILIDVDKRTPAPQVAAYNGAWTLDGGVAVSNSWYAPPGKADDWMITPVVSGMDNTTVLKWDARALDPSFRNGYEVRVSPTGGATTADFTDIVFETSGEATTLTSREVSLAAYVGKNIRIAFRDVSNDMFLLVVDNISVVSFKQVDGSTLSNATLRYLPVGQEATVEFAFVNQGLVPVTKFTYEWSNGVDTYQETVSNVNLATEEFYLGTVKFPVNEASTYNVTFDIISINDTDDEYKQNDISSTLVNGVTKSIKKIMVAEEATGTWCTWCPRGVVFMERMSKDYPNEFIGVAVHNSDPMAIADYDGGLTGLPGFGGFPSVVINRESIIDPSELPDYLTTVTRNEFSPVEMNVEQSKVGREMTISGDITFFTNADEANYSVVVAVLEDEVKGTEEGYAQVNAYSGGGQGVMGGFESLPNPVPASQMVYQEVARALPFGFEGRATIIPAEIKEDDTFLFSVSYTLPNSFVVGNIRSVLFLRDNTTGQIVSGAKSESFAVGIEEVSEIASLSIAPNPTNTETFVNLELKSSSDVSMTVYNNIGQQVASRNYGKLDGRQILPISVDTYETGIYFIKLTVNGKVTTQKLIVE